ncbi:sulfatase-like hydrolase/transferase [Paenibacillus allorhizosphaerae]|uniref:Choline-sulfatase n=1 Tax=Paenibacillus allorhizosphaerae TaxID=2849866 RepID=A0ABM8V9Q1_9BACL|nr:sulfatase-like hydrolase/transferase [Paenibacillus allorhizosphaerae]CAG7613971.1 Choline-sulfatase [Paenibacillus allorhizosphaerae]
MSKHNRTNILIFMTDQQQAQVTLPGHPCRTPNLDRIARDGIRFTNAYPPMAHCCPARASFMTGLYPSQHGIYNNVSNEQAICRSLKPGVETFSEKLKEAGYQLFFSGKWHVSATENPKDRGWEELHVNAGVGAYMGIHRDKWRENKAQIDEDLSAASRKKGEIVRPGWGNVQLYGTSPKALQELGDYRVVRKGIEQLDRLKDGEKPWCLYIGVTGPHDPFIIPEKYATMYSPDDIELPPNYNDTLTDKPALYRRMRKVFDILSEQEVKESIAHYWGYCSMIDDLFGEVVDALQRNEQLDNTLVLFLSDHGEHAGAHGLYAKGLSHFDEGYRVPLVAHCPGLIKSPGKTVEHFVTLMDIAPTLIDVAGASKLNKCSGASLMPFFDDAEPDGWRESVYAQCNGVEVYYTSRMVRTNQYKFVYHPTDIDELYDVRNDPYEMNNLAELPEMASLKKEMYQRMWRHAFQSEDTIFNKYVTVATADYGPGIADL